MISAVLAEPIVRILFQHGQITPSQTPVVAGALAAFSAGLVFNGAMLMLNRAFFSLQENWIPTMVALGNLFLNAVLDFAFYRYGVWGIPLSTAFVNLAGSWALFVLLRRGASAGWRAARSQRPCSRSSSRQPWSPPSRGPSGVRSTPRSDAPSPASSSRSAWPLPPRSRPISSAAGSCRCAS